MPWSLLKPMDTALWLAALLALGALYFTLWQPAGQAASVKVMLDNEVLQQLPLSENQQISVHGPLGDSLLQVKDGQVRFISSPCRNQVCVHHGWASHSGELLACLPNRIALVLEGNAEVQADIDAVNF